MNYNKGLESHYFGVNQFTDWVRNLFAVLINLNYKIAKKANFCKRTLVVLVLEYSTGFMKNLVFFVSIKI